MTMSIGPINQSGKYVFYRLYTSIPTFIHSFKSNKLNFINQLAYINNVPITLTSKWLPN